MTQDKPHQGLRSLSPRIRNGCSHLGMEGLDAVQVFYIFLAVQLKQHTFILPLPLNKFLFKGEGKSKSIPLFSLVVYMLCMLLF